MLCGVEQKNGLAHRKRRHESHVQAEAPARAAAALAATCCNIDLKPQRGSLLLSWEQPLQAALQSQARGTHLAWERHHSGHDTRQRGGGAIMVATSRRAELAGQSGGRSRDGRGLSSGACIVLPRAQSVNRKARHHPAGLGATERSTCIIAYTNEMIVMPDSAG